MLTDMRWEYLSIWTVTSARAGGVANADIAAPAISALRAIGSTAVS